MKKETKKTETPVKMKKENKMYKVPNMKDGSLRRYNTVEGESIEMKIERIVNNKEPIKDGAPIIYTERKEGIKHAYNIRTNRFDVAIEATDKIARSYKARREERAKGMKAPGGETTSKNGEPESTQGKAEGTK